MTFNKLLIFYHQRIWTVTNSLQMSPIQYLKVMDLHNFWLLKSHGKAALKKREHPVVESMPVMELYWYCVSEPACLKQKF